MKRIFLIGAGRSSSDLIQYLLLNAESQNWFVTIGDLDLSLVQGKVKAHPKADAILFDINNEEQRITEISSCDLVISMLPAHMHLPVALDCLRLRKNMVTASYVSKEMVTLHEEASAAGVILLNEMGVDPGIDHMSAKKVIDGIREKGGVLDTFETFTGGLIAPESDTNPWNYKFTWNPRNVVMAGQGTPVKFIQEGKYKYVPYHKIFRRTEKINIENHGRFEGYANRDSLAYREIYGLQDIRTMYRGTLRRPGFCKAWNIFVQMGLTDDSFYMDNVKGMTHRDFVNSFLPYNERDSVELKFKHYNKFEHDDEDLFEKFEWLGIFEQTPLNLERATPAQILQKILEAKWGLDPEDKDMIVMWHKFIYMLEGKKFEVQSSMVTKGTDPIFTAMSKTVGLPVAIAAKLILNGTITTPGVQIPITAEIYEPVLKELENFGVEFTETEKEIQAQS